MKVLIGNTFDSTMQTLDRLKKIDKHHSKTSTEGITFRETGVENHHLKCQALKKGYLLYYNNVLFKNGLITEQERNQMILEIDHYYPIERVMQNSAEK